ncbi:hypothetical protein PC116_g31808 [Phytophthora cactorum]|nr:hypothetical protein PC116_g31808 [Phytophthora cactorum]
MHTFCDKGLAFFPLYDLQITKNSLRQEPQNPNFSVEERLKRATPVI